MTPRRNLALRFRELFLEGRNQRARRRNVVDGGGGSEGADLEMKRRALEATPTPITVGPLVQRHEPDILRWLEQL